MAKNITAVVVCAVILFVWGFLSWAVLPWHMDASVSFENEEAVSTTLQANANAPGVYIMPFEEEDPVPGRAFVFASIHPNGMDMNMPRMMGVGMIGQLLSAALVLTLLCHTTGLSYFQRVRFVALVGLAIGFIGHFPYWNWFGFSTPYVAVIVIDSLVAWTLAGLVMAKFVGGQAAAPEAQTD